MKLEIKTKNWNLETIKGKKKITGTYVVMYGDKEVADKSFNGQYCSQEINFPAELQAKIETIDNEINEYIKKTFE